MYPSRQTLGTPPIGRFVAALTLAVALLLPVLVAAPAVQAKDPDPSARVMLRIRAIHVFDNGAYAGTGEPTYNVSVQTTRPGCGTDPSDPHPLCHDQTATASYQFFDVESGAVETVDPKTGAMLIPPYHAQPSQAAGPTPFQPPEPGLALYPGQSLLLTVHGLAHHCCGLGDTDLGSFQVSYDQAQNWGMGSVHFTSSTNAGDVVGGGGTMPGFQVDYGIIPAPLPDLVVSTLQVGPLLADGLHQICATVDNLGQELASPFTVRVYIDGVIPPGGTITTTGYLLPFRATTPPSQQQVCVQAAITPVQHTFLATVDEDQQVPEMNELNNSRGLAINIAREGGGSVPPVQVGGITTGPAPTAIPTLSPPRNVQHPIIAGTTTASASATATATSRPTAIPTMAPTTPPAPPSVPTEPPTPTDTPTAAPTSAPIG